MNKVGIQHKTILAHGDTLRFLKRLLIDLEHHLRGRRSLSPVDDRRLNMAWQHIKKIQACRRPALEVICLCGSTRFTDQMLIKQWELTKQGHIVLSWCPLPGWYAQGNNVAEWENVVEVIDEVHKRKIDLADKIFVVNVGGYIGESTRSEIEYAEANGKSVEYLEPK